MKELENRFTAGQLAAMPLLANVKLLDGREQREQSARDTDARRAELGLDSDRCQPSPIEMAKATRI